jgi:hypothetical protein
MSTESDWSEYDNHPYVVAEKARYASNAKEILSAAEDNATNKNDKSIRMQKLIGIPGPHFVICGVAEDDKAHSIEMANRQLNPDETINAIAQCLDFANCGDVEEIERGMKSTTTYSYDGYRFIAFSIMSKQMGMLLATRNPNLRVVFLKGYTSASSLGGAI